MKTIRSSCAVAALIMALGHAGSALADPVATPPISPPLAANPEPATFAAGPFGNIKVTGVLTGLAYTQSNPLGSDKKSRADVSNAQIFINDVAIGGSDDLAALERDGKLDALLGL